MFEWIEELSKIKHVCLVLLASLLKHFDKSLRNHLKILALIDLDHAIIASTFLFDNATSNDMVNELGFTAINAFIFAGLQL